MDAVILFDFEDDRRELNIIIRFWEVRKLPGGLAIECKSSLGKFKSVLKLLIRINSVNVCYLITVAQSAVRFQTTVGE